VIVDLYCASYTTPPATVVLDIDDTVDVVHGHQQLSLFNAHFDERCFFPIHVYDTATGRPVAMILRPGKTPSGVEVRGHIRRLAPGDSPPLDRRLASPSAGTDTIVGRRSWTGVRRTASITSSASPARRLSRPRSTSSPTIRVERAIEDKEAVRGFAETTHAAQSWTRERRVAARIEATRLGLDIRYVVTNITSGTAEWLYADLYCARGQAENLIKLHLRPHQLPGRHRQPDAAFLHTAAYWLALAVRDAIPKAHALAKAVHDDQAPATEGRRPRHRDRQLGAHRLRQRLPGRRPLPLPGGLDQAGRALSRGASGPGQPAPSPPTHSTRSAYAAVKNTLRTTARPKPLIKNQNFAEGLSDQVRRLSAGLPLAHLNSSADVGIGRDRISSDHAYRPTAGAGGVLTAVDPTPTRLRKTAK